MPGFMAFVLATDSLVEAFSCKHEKAALAFKENVKVRFPLASFQFSLFKVFKLMGQVYFPIRNSFIKLELGLQRLDEQVHMNFVLHINEEPLWVKDLAKASMQVDSLKQMLAQEANNVAKKESTLLPLLSLPLKLPSRLT